MKSKLVLCSADEVGLELTPRPPHSRATKRKEKNFTGLIQEPSEKTLMLKGAGIVHLSGIGICGTIVADLMAKKSRPSKSYDTESILGDRFGYEIIVT